MRFIPAPENPDDFFTDSISDSSTSSFSPSQRGPLIFPIRSLTLTPLGLIQTHKRDDIEAYSMIHPGANFSSSRPAYNPLQGDENGHRSNGTGRKGLNIGR